MPTKTIRTMKEILWNRVPFNEYVEYVRYLGGRKLKTHPSNPDFPIEFPMKQEIAKDDVVLEIGANIGANTLELARLARRVYSFEPSPSTYRWLRRNTRGAQNVRCFNEAVSGESGVARLNVQNRSSSLFRGDGIHYTRQVSVRTVGINRLPFGFNVVVSDSEGAEVPIFEAFDRWGEVDKVFVEGHWIEGAPTLPRIRQILRSHYSFVGDGVDPGGYPWVVAKR
jgi:FkbM family methyltransferase